DASSTLSHLGAPMVACVLFLNLVATPHQTCTVAFSVSSSRTATDFRRRDFPHPASYSRIRGQQDTTVEQGATPYGCPSFLAGGGFVAAYTTTDFGMFAKY
ncbi:hypothetical protein LX36DRAFT_585290, partial [Colletotrichum falcatum]